MLNEISKHKFYDMSQLVRLRGTQTAQTAHCAVCTAVKPSDQDLHLCGAIVKIFELIVESCHVRPPPPK